MCQSSRAAPPKPTQQKRDSERAQEEDKEPSRARLHELSSLASGLDELFRVAIEHVRYLYMFVLLNRVSQAEPIHPAPGAQPVASSRGDSLLPAASADPQDEHDASEVEGLIEPHNAPLLKPVAVSLLF